MGASGQHWGGCLHGRCWAGSDDEDDDVLYQRVPPDDPQVEMSDKFVMSNSGPSYEYSLSFLPASQHHAGHYVCVVFSGGQLSH